jgi:hypothetical protein
VTARHGPRDRGIRSENLFRTWNPPAVPVAVPATDPICRLPSHLLGGHCWGCEGCCCRRQAARQTCSRNRSRFALSPRASKDVAGAGASERLLFGTLKRRRDTAAQIAEIFATAGSPPLAIPKSPLSTARRASNEVVSTGVKRLGAEAAVCKPNLCLARTAAKLQVSARDREAAPDAFTVATFVPAQADICRLLNGQTAFDVRNILIDMSRANDLRIRNAWVRGSNPLCGTNT